MAYDVIGFAKSELEKYLEALGVSAEIELGLFDGSRPSLPVDNPFLDDAFVICVKARRGFIVGSNERSVLMGVYRLLEEWGIRWVRPGKNGTHYPDVCTAPDLDIREKASLRHRTMCIEGAVSIENVLDMIEWCPKQGFNGYYIQFDSAFTFFDRWYSHGRSTVKAPEPIDNDKAKEYVAIMTREIKKRGLMLQRMGHGWTCGPFGMDGDSWDPMNPEDIPEAYKNLCAEVDGKREVWANIPLRTQLCYTNPEVVETISDAIVDYTEQNPDTDVIHFWLGDWSNNYCECESCRKYRVSDVYINLLNHATEKLAKKQSNKLLVFTIGSNKAFPPSVEKLKHPEMLMLMFAPISRTFSKSFPNEFTIKTIPQYVHNGYENPRSVDKNLSYLYAWEQIFSGDAVDFDYHLMWDHILDAGGEGIARVIYDDVRNLGNLGMNGYISCQLQRNSFPTAVAMTVMGKTLWNTSADFDTIRRDLYAASFGEDMAGTMCDYFATLSRGFDIGRIKSHRPFDKDEFARDVQAAIDAMKAMKPLANERAQSTDDPCRKECWHTVALNAEIYSVIGQAILVRLGGDIEESQRIVKSAAQIVWEKEDELQGMLDGYFFEGMTRTRITPEKAIAFSDT